MASRRVRRTPEEADRLRARMIREGYPLADLARKENDYFWQTLTQRRRWEQLQALTGMSDEALRARVKEMRRQYQAKR